MEDNKKVNSFWEMKELRDKMEGRTSERYANIQENRFMNKGNTNNNNQINMNRNNNEIINTRKEIASQRANKNINNFRNY